VVVRKFPRYSADDSRDTLSVMAAGNAGMTA